MYFGDKIIELSNLKTVYIMASKTYLSFIITFDTELLNDLILKLGIFQLYISWLSHDYML